MREIWHDTLRALRNLRRRPAFTVAVLVPLALGIGATSAIFSAVNAVVLRPLPYDEPETIVRVWEIRPRLGMAQRPGGGGFSTDHFRAWRDNNTVFHHMAAYSRASYNVTGLDEPRRMSGSSVSSDLFSLLGVPPSLGRGFTTEEERPGSARVIVLSYRTWRSQFGADEGIIGRIVRLDDEPYTVVGVMPSRFTFPDTETEFWVPLVVEPSRPGSISIMPVLARLKRGVTIQQAQAEAQALVEGLAAESDEGDPRHRGVEVRLGSLHEQMVSPVRPALYVLMAAVGFVLLIVCANVANLLLAQAAGRDREIAVRAAMGAGRLRLIRHLLVESLLLGALGGISGLVVAFVGIRLLAGLDPGNIPRLAEISIDLKVLAFALVVALVTAVVFGLVPALRSSRVDLTVSLKERIPAMGLGLFRRSRGRAWLVVVEVALALVLLVGAGLMIESFARLTRVDAGYEPRGVLTAGLNLPEVKYGDHGSRSGFYEQVLQRLGEVRGVREVGMVNVLPMEGSRFVIGLQIAGRPAPTRPEEVPRADLRIVSPGYFQAMGITLLRGRFLNSGDDSEAPPVVLVNDAFAREQLAGEDPLAQRLQVGEIVGVVGDVRSFGLDEEPVPEVYVCYRQAAGPLARSLSRMSLVVRASEDVAPLSLVAGIRAQVGLVDSEMPIADVVTMERRMADSVARPRFYSVLLGLFAGLALVLSATGIYGVVSYSVSRRTAETGIRMALGAQTGRIMKLVVGEGMLLAAVGIALGLVAALAATRALSGLLFGVGTTEPLTFIGVAALLAAVALLACYLPARRAARVDPVEALRYE